MFVLHDFVMSTLKGMSAVYPQWQVQQNALGYFAKGWISEIDLADVASWYKVAEPEPAEEEGVENDD